MLCRFCLKEQADGYIVAPRDTCKIILPMCKSCDWEKVARGHDGYKMHHMPGVDVEDTVVTPSKPPEARKPPPGGPRTGRIPPGF